MPSSKRTYFRSSLNELRQIFASHQSEVLVLEALSEELGQRTRPAAIALRRDVQQRLREINDGKTAPTRELQQSELLPPVQLREEDVVVAGAQKPLRPQQSLDEHLKPPLRLKRIEPMGVVGRPSKYVRNPKTDVTLDTRAGMPPIARYTVALAALVSDMRRAICRSLKTIESNPDSGTRGQAFVAPQSCAGPPPMPPVHDGYGLATTQHFS